MIELIEEFVGFIDCEVVREECESVEAPDASVLVECF
jgi:hypothetical protein